MGRNKNDGEEQDHQPSKTSIMTQGTMDLDEYLVDSADGMKREGCVETKDRRRENDNKEGASLKTPCKVDLQYLKKETGLKCVDIHRRDDSREGALSPMFGECINCGWGPSDGQGLSINMGSLET